MDEDPDVERAACESTDCRLVRPDGSTWWVDELTFTRYGLKVRAERIVANGTPGDWLDSVYLTAGDRLEWLDEDGEIVRSHQNPVDES